MSATEPQPFRILAVCTGNICRSPAVERLLAHWLGAAGVVTASAGTGALVGRAVEPQMARLLEADGASDAGFAARQLTQPLIAQADLVLALTRRHRSEVVQLHPPALRTAFTLRELARLARVVDASALPTESGPARLRALLPLAYELRPVHRDPGDDDVVDPYRRADKTYQLSYDQLRAPIKTLCEIAVA